MWYQSTFFLLIVICFCVTLAHFELIFFVRDGSTNILARDWFDINTVRTSPMLAWFGRSYAIWLWWCAISLRSVSHTISFCWQSASNSALFVDVRRRMFSSTCRDRTVFKKRYFGLSLLPQSVFAAMSDEGRFALEYCRSCSMQLAANRLMD